MGYREDFIMTVAPFLIFLIIVLIILIISMVTDKGK